MGAIRGRLNCREKTTGRIHAKTEEETSQKISGNNKRTNPRDARAFILLHIAFEVLFL
jgi:hypothetical protein